MADVPYGMGANKKRFREPFSIQDEYCAYNRIRKKYPGRPQTYALDLSSGKFERDMVYGGDRNYTRMIACVLLDAQQHRLKLYQIYQHVLDKFPYLQELESRKVRQNIRRNLIGKECFLMLEGAVRLEGRGHDGKAVTEHVDIQDTWGIHPACISSLSNGNYGRGRMKMVIARWSKP